MLCCSRKSSARTSQKIRVPFAFQLDFLETFCKWSDLERQESGVLFLLGLFFRRSYHQSDWQRLIGTKKAFLVYTLGVFFRRYFNEVFELLGPTGA